MGIEKQDIVIDTLGVQNLRFYKHIKSNGIYFVNGYSTQESNLETQIIYTDGYTGTIFTRPAKEFVVRFKLIEKR